MWLLGAPGPRGADLSRGGMCGRRGPGPCGPALGPSASAPAGPPKGRGAGDKGRSWPSSKVGQGSPGSADTGPGACGAVPTPSPRRSLGVEEVAGKSDLVRLPAPASLPES